MSKEIAKNYGNIRDTEKLKFLQKEYEFNRERKNGLLRRAETLFAWNNQTRKN